MILCLVGRMSYFYIVTLPSAALWVNLAGEQLHLKLQEVMLTFNSRSQAKPLGLTNKVLGAWFLIIVYDLWYPKNIYATVATLKSIHSSYHIFTLVVLPFVADDSLHQWPGLFTQLSLNSRSQGGAEVQQSEQWTSWICQHESAI